MGRQEVEELRSPARREAKAGSGGWRSRQEWVQERKQGTNKPTASAKRQ